MTRHVIPTLKVIFVETRMATCLRCEVARKCTTCGENAHAPPKEKRRRTMPVAKNHAAAVLRHPLEAGTGLVIAAGHAKGSHVASPPVAACLRRGMPAQAGSTGARCAAGVRRETRRGHRS